MISSIWRSSSWKGRRRYNGAVQTHQLGRCSSRRRQAKRARSGVEDGGKRPLGLRDVPGRAPPPASERALTQHRIGEAYGDRDYVAWDAWLGDARR